MIIERISGLERRARLHAALSEPTRLAIVDQLGFSDATPSELAAILQVPSNLLAHHLKFLEAEGIVARSRSEADRRRSYLRLDPTALGALDAGSTGIRATRVVFVCTANSARSQLAAALWRRASDLPATSAGTHPAARIDPGVLATARRHGLGLRARRPRALDDVVERGDLVITVCDNAHEELRPAGGLHWSVPDPVTRGSARAFDLAYEELDRRVGALAPQVQAR